MQTVGIWRPEMLDFSMRPSLRLIQQIARIERFAGNWERLALSAPLASPETAEIMLAEGVEAMLALDSSSPAGLFLDDFGEHPGPIVRERISVSVLDGVDSLEKPSRHAALEALAEGHRRELPLTPAGIAFLYKIITHDNYQTINWLTFARSGLEETNGVAYRYSAANFLTPERQLIFPTVSPFLIEERLKELLEWTNTELKSDILHPLVVIGTFHLLFLQVHPFASANHRLSLLLVWQLLIKHGYDYVRFSHFAPTLRSRSWQYFSALRQAEKTAYGDWSTLNSWLEFFLDALMESSSKLLESTQDSLRRTRLTPVQRRIIEVVKSHGSATRDLIVNETGINLSTVKYNLSILSGNGQLRREGGGRTTSYSIV